VPAEPEVRPRAHRGVRRVPAAAAARRDGVPHASWREARDLLLEQGVAWCVAETDEQDPGPDDLSWEPFGFLRLRKTEYSDEELQAWAERIGPALEAGHDVYCYLKHEDEGASPKMADRLRALLATG
jgi:uncharacterized protein YecE (DUF72 family)